MATARLPVTISIAYCVFALSCAANAAPVSTQAVREAMAIVEVLLAEQDIDVSGYAGTTPPAVERVAASHEYLQGNDGGYVDGRIYLNDEVVAECLQLTLVHELVHDATVKHRLFAAVPNARIQDIFEALADVVTAAAAAEPFLPGCLPRRPILLGSADLASLALPALRR